MKRCISFVKQELHNIKITHQKLLQSPSNKLKYLKGKMQQSQLVAHNSCKQIYKHDDESKVIARDGMYKSCSYIVAIKKHMQKQSNTNLLK